MEEDNNRANKLIDNKQPYKHDRDNDKKRGVPEAGAFGEERDENSALTIYYFIIVLLDIII